MIRFSVVTITYNAEAALQRTLDSVFCQTHSEVEHLIVDGASADGTLSMAEAYRQRSEAAGSHTVRIVSEPDNGLYDAMNKGLKMASGDYVCFLNAGDFLPSPSTLADIAACGERARGACGMLPAVLYGDTDIVDAGGNFLRKRRLSPPDNLSWRSFREGMLVCHQAFYARTDIARTVDYDLSFRYSADIDWCIRVMKAAEQGRVPLVGTGLTIADYTREGLSTVHHRASLGERYRIMVRHYGWLTTAAMHVWFVFRAVLKR